MTTKFDAVIFDMDGLLLDTERPAKEFWRKAALEFGFDLPEEIYVRVIGTTAQDTERILMEGMGSGFPFHDIRARRRQLGDEYVKKHGVALKVGVRELIQQLAQREIPVAVATSTRREEALKRLAMHDLLKFFGGIACGDEVARGKPSPDLFLLAAERIAAEPTHCIVLEDSEPGIRAALNAGMTPIMVPDVKAPSDEIRAVAHALFSSLIEVAPYLEELFVDRLTSAMTTSSPAIE